MSSFSDILSFALIVFLASDGLLNMSILNAALKDSSESRALSVLLRELTLTLPSSLVLVLIAVGTLKVLHIPVCAVIAVSGAFIMLNGLKAIFGKDDSSTTDYTSLTNSSFFPITVPLILGPSWLSSCFILVSKESSLISCFFIVFCSWILLCSAVIFLYKFTRKGKVLQAVRTIIGLFASIIGAQFLIKGLQLALLP